MEKGLVVVAASAGGVDVLRSLFQNLPEDFPVPIVVVLHIHSDSLSIGNMFLEESILPVVELSDRQELRPGTIYFAPPDYHVLLEENGICALDVGPPEQYVRPCANKLFVSAARVFGKNLIGVICSGIGEDGALGLERIVSSGGRALVQRMEDAPVPSMPEAALRRVPEAIQFRAFEGGILLREQLRYNR